MVEQTPATPAPRARRRKLLWITGGAAVVLAAAIALGLWWFFRDDAPAKVNIDTAAAGVSTTAAPATIDSTDTADAAAPAGLDGTWNVDTSTGEFDFKSATGTFVGFRIKEKLANIGDAEAVGRTGHVEGSFTIEGTTVTTAQITARLSTIVTNESMRDRRVKEALDTDQFPTATFQLTEPIDLGPDAASGATIDVTADGDLTVHGVTRHVSVPLQARLVGDTAVVVGSLDVTFADYGVTVPSSVIVLSVEDHGTIELQLLLKR